MGEGAEQRITARHEMLRPAVRKERKELRSGTLASNAKLLDKRRFDPRASDAHAMVQRVSRDWSHAVSLTVYVSMHFFPDAAVLPV